MMIQYYNNGLKYFNVNDIFPNDKKPLTTTPFLFITSNVRDLINHIEKEEKMKFYDFFKKIWRSGKKNKKITEFYFYTTYLIYTRKINNYIMEPDIKMTIFHNPNDEWNKYDRKKKVITDNRYKVFGLHRLAVKNMDKKYKHNLKKMYRNFYNKKELVLINNILKD